MGVQRADGPLAGGRGQSPRKTPLAGSPRETPYSESAPQQQHRLGNQLAATGCLQKPQAYLLGSADGVSVNSLAGVMLANEIIFAYLGKITEWDKNRASEDLLAYPACLEETDFFWK